MAYSERLTFSGKMLEVEQRYETQSGRTPGSTNTAVSTDGQERINDLQSWRKLTRMIQCNFSREDGDLCVTLTFARYNDRQEARKQYTKFLRKLRDVRKRRGLGELKYILIDEVQSGRQHAHIVVNGGVSLEEMTAIWDSMGSVSASVLRDTNNYRDLAAYLLQQHKTRRGSQNEENAKAPRRKNERRWTCSRNLKKPVVKKRPCKPVTMKTMPRVPRGYRGYTVLPEFERGVDIYGNLWLRWVCIRTEPEKGKRGRRAGVLREPVC